MINDLHRIRMNFQDVIDLLRRAKSELYIAYDEGGSCGWNVVLDVYFWLEEAVLRLEEALQELDRFYWNLRKNHRIHNDL